jgi:hypothetical protein
MGCAVVVDEDLLRRADALLGATPSANGHGRHANGEADSVHSDHSVPTEWPDIIPLGEVDVPEFPTHILPAWQRRFVVEESEAKQTPPDLPAMQTQGVIAVAVAKRVVVKVRDGWVEPLNRYGMTALAPGERKSPVHRSAVAPVDAYEAGRRANDAEAIARAETERKVLEQTLARAEKEAANATGPERAGLIDAAKAVAIDLAKATVAAPTRILADDITPEAVAQELAQQGGRIGIISDEGGIFELIAGRYGDKGKAPNLDVFLKGHAGGTVRVRRIGRADDLVPDAAVTIELAIQPAVVAGMANHPAFRGRGLSARFAYAIPRPRIGRRKVNAPPTAAATREAYEGRVKRLLCISPVDPPHQLVFSEDADQLMAAFEEELETRLSEFGDLGHIADWGGKLAGLTARHAAHFHLCDHVDDPEPWAGEIGPDVVGRAIELSREYLIPHALAAFALMGADPNLADARFLLRWLTARPDPRATFTKRDAYRAARGRVKRVEDIDRPLGLLVQHGYVRIQPPPEPAPGEPRAGRKPSPAYELNPAWEAERDGRP